MIKPIFHDLLLDASASSAHRSLDPDSANYQSLGKEAGSSQEVILTEEDLKRIYLLVQASNVSKKPCLRGPCPLPPTAVMTRGCGWSADNSTTTAKRT